MPKFTKVSRAEMEELRKRRIARVDLTEYQSFLNGLRAGEGGKIALEENESQRAVKRRLTTAAKQRGMQIRYRRSDPGQIFFEVK